MRLFMVRRTRSFIIRNYAEKDDRTDPPRYQRKRHDGVVLEVQSHRGADGSVVRTFADVTATVQAQQALQASEARFRAMADAAPALIWQSDTAGSPVWFNQRWLQYTGRTLAEEPNEPAAGEVTECAELMAPRVPALGEAVAQHHGRAVGGSRFGDVHADAVGFDETIADEGETVGDG